VCAYLVVVLHCLEVKDGHPFAQMIVTCFSQQAVPFFFIVSGYFFSQRLFKANDPMAETLQYTKKQVLLYFAWMVIEFPWLIQTYLEMYSGRSALYIAAVVLRRVLFAGQGVYWYILVLAEACMITGLCIKWKKENILYVTAAIGLVFGFIYDAGINYGFLENINQAVYIVFSWSNNLFMKGLPYVAIGAFIARNTRFHRINRQWLIAAYTVISLLSVILFWILYNYDINLSRYLYFYPIQAALLFLIALQPSSMTIRKEISDHCRDLSATTYFVHATIIYRFVDVIWSVDSPIFFKFMVTVIISSLLYIIIKATKIKPLCWLLSIKH
jgi:hypothetical protein